MSEETVDHRLVYGAVIWPDVWFELEPVSLARTHGRNAAPEPGCVTLEFGLKPLEDIALEGQVESLSALPGVLYVTSQRERTQRLGRISRDANGYSVTINLFEPELDRFLKLLVSGLTPGQLKLEFDIEVHQWVEIEGYWDDVRYPYVDIHEYRIDWKPRKAA